MFNKTITIVEFSSPFERKSVFVIYIFTLSYGYEHSMTKS